MTGSVIDGEDVVQEALLKAVEALPRMGWLYNPEGWVFRIAHNAAQDFHIVTSGQCSPTRTSATMAVNQNDVSDRQAAAASLRTFMRLPVSQRSSVILRDLLGYSVEEIVEILGGTILAIKGTRRRGRIQLRALAEEPDETPLPALEETDRLRLASYIDRFNLRDFDAIRDMLADDVRLELVNRLRLKGRQPVGVSSPLRGSAGQMALRPRIGGRPAGLLHPAGLGRRQGRGHSRLHVRAMRWRTPRSASERSEPACVNLPCWVSFDSGRRRPSPDADSLAS